MLSFVPANAVLRDAGCPPTLRHHRHLVLHGPGVLRTVATGFIGREAEEQRLSVISPNLLACCDCAKSSCHVNYTCNPRVAKATIEDELLRAAPGWASAYRRP